MVKSAWWPRTRISPEIKMPSFWATIAVLALFSSSTPFISSSSDPDLGSVRVVFQVRLPPIPFLLLSSFLFDSCLYSKNPQIQVLGFVFLQMHEFPQSLISFLTSGCRILVEISMSVWSKEEKEKKNIKHKILFFEGAKAYNFKGLKNWYWGTNFHEIGQLDLFSCMKKQQEEKSTFWSVEYTKNWYRCLILQERIKFGMSTPFRLRKSWSSGN